MAQERLIPLIQILKDKGANVILILADTEGEDINKVRKFIDPESEHLVILAVQTIEAWLLADSKVISEYFQHKFYCENPEEIVTPFDFIKEKNLEFWGRGCSKRLLVPQLLKNGFSIKNAANHPNCPSAKYFIETLKSINSNSSN